MHPRVEAGAPANRLLFLFSTLALLLFFGCAGLGQPSGESLITAAFGTPPAVAGEGGACNAGAVPETGGNWVIAAASTEECANGTIIIKGNITLSAADSKLVLRNVTLMMNSSGAYNNTINVSAGTLVIANNTTIMEVGPLEQNLSYNISVTSGNLFINDSTISNGGQIVVQDATGTGRVNISNSTIANFSGIALYILSNTTTNLSNVLFINNSAGFYAASTLNPNSLPHLYLSNLTFAQTYGEATAGLYIVNVKNITPSNINIMDSYIGLFLVNSSNISIDSFTFFNNTFGMAASLSNFTIRNTTFLNNSYGIISTSEWDNNNIGFYNNTLILNASVGAGILSGNSTYDVRNSTFSGVGTLTAGIGIQNGSSFNITNTTFALSTSDLGGCIAFVNDYNYLNITNSTCVGNGSGYGIYGPTGSTTGYSNRINISSSVFSNLSAGLYVTNMSVEMNSSSVLHTNRSEIWATGIALAGTNATLFNITFFNNYVGMRLFGSSNLTVLNSTITNNTKAGVLLSNGSNVLNLSNSRIATNDTGISPSGTDGYSTVTLSSSNITNTSSTTSIGIYLIHYASLTLDSALISGFSSYGIALSNSTATLSASTLDLNGNGILLTGRANSTLTISDSNITNSTGNGIFTDGGSSDGHVVTILRSNMTGNGGGNGGVYVPNSTLTIRSSHLFNFSSIIVASRTNVTVSNTTFNTYLRGVFITGNNTNVNITNSSLVGQNASTYHIVGNGVLENITVLLNDSDVSIGEAGAYISNTTLTVNASRLHNLTYGILIYVNSSITVYNSTIANNTRGGIQQYYATSGVPNSVSYSTITGNGGYAYIPDSDLERTFGIYIMEGGAWSIFMNNISDNNYSGIVFGAPDTIEIYGNNLTNQMEGITAMTFDVNAQNISIHDNNITGNNLTGMYLALVGYGDSIPAADIYSNNISFNGYGIVDLMSGGTVLIYNNTIANNSYDAIQTISSNSSIYNNTIGNNSYGFGMLPGPPSSEDGRELSDQLALLDSSNTIGKYYYGILFAPNATDGDGTPASNTTITINSSCAGIGAFDFVPVSFEERLTAPFTGRYMLNRSNITTNGTGETAYLLLFYNWTNNTGDVQDCAGNGTIYITYTNDFLGANTTSYTTEDLQAFGDFNFADPISMGSSYPACGGIPQLTIGGSGSIPGVSGSDYACPSNANITEYTYLPAAKSDYTSGENFTLTTRKLGRYLRNASTTSQICESDCFSSCRDDCYWIRYSRCRQACTSRCGNGKCTVHDEFCSPYDENFAENVSICDADASTIGYTGGSYFNSTTNRLDNKFISHPGDNGSLVTFAASKTGYLTCTNPAGCTLEGVYGTTNVTVAAGSNTPASLQGDYLLSDPTLTLDYNSTTCSIVQLGGAEEQCNKLCRRDCTENWVNTTTYTSYISQCVSDIDEYIYIRTGNDCTGAVVDSYRIIGMGASASNHPVPLESGTYTFCNATDTLIKTINVTSAEACRILVNSSNFTQGAAYLPVPIVFQANLSAPDKRFDLTFTRWADDERTQPMPLPRFLSISTTNPGVGVINVSNITAAGSSPAISTVYLNLSAWDPQPEDWNYFWDNIELKANSSAVNCSAYFDIRISNVSTTPDQYVELNGSAAKTGVNYTGNGTTTQATAYEIILPEPIYKMLANISVKNRSDAEQVPFTLRRGPEFAGMNRSKRIGVIQSELNYTVDANVTNISISSITNTLSSSTVNITNLGANVTVNKSIIRGISAGKNILTVTYTPEGGTAITIPSSAYTYSSSSGEIAVDYDVEVRYATGSNKFTITYAYCGDGSCNAGELCSSCASDCGACGGGTTTTITTLPSLSLSVEGGECANETMNIGVSSGGVPVKSTILVFYDDIEVHSASASSTSFKPAKAGTYRVTASSGTYLSAASSEIVADCARCVPPDPRCPGKCTASAEPSSGVGKFSSRISVKCDHIPAGDALITCAEGESGEFAKFDSEFRATRTCTYPAVDSVRVFTVPVTVDGNQLYTYVTDRPSTCSVSADPSSAASPFTSLISIDCPGFDKTNLTCSARCSQAASAQPPSDCLPERSADIAGSDFKTVSLTDGKGSTECYFALLDCTLSASPSAGYAPLSSTAALRCGILPPDVTTALVKCSATSSFVNVSFANGIASIQCSYGEGGGARTETITATVYDPSGKPFVYTADVGVVAGGEGKGCVLSASPSAGYAPFTSTATVECDALTNTTTAEMRCSEDEQFKRVDFTGKEASISCSYGAEEGERTETIEAVVQGLGGGDGNISREPESYETEVQVSLVDAAGVNTTVAAVFSDAVTYTMVEVLSPFSPKLCKSLGSECSKSRECCSGYPCIGGRCKVCGEIGEFCSGSRDCCTGYCQGGTCVLPPSAKEYVLGPKSPANMALWPVVVGVSVLAAYGARHLGVRLVPVVIAIVPIAVSLITFPFLGLVISLAELIGVAIRGRSVRQEEAAAEEGAQK